MDNVKPKIKEDVSVYDSVFNFIFATQEKKEKREKPLNEEELGDFSQALMEVGAQPLLYPLNTAFESINDYIAKTTEIDIGGGVKGGAGSGIFGDPNKYSKTEISKNRSRATWASVGGSLHYMTDGALFSLLSKRNGVDSKIAMESGKLYGDLLKEEMIRGKTNPNSGIFGRDFLSPRKPRNDYLFGYQTEKEILDKDKEFFRKGINIRVDSILKENPTIPKDVLLENIKDGQRYASRGDRLERTREILQLQGLSRIESEDVAKVLWGERGGSDQGVFMLGRERAGNEIDRILGNNSFQGTDKERLVDFLKKTNDEAKRREIYRIVRRNTGLTATLAYGITQEISDLKLNDGFDIAKESIYSSLSLKIRENLARKWQVNREDVPEHAVRERLEGVLDSTSRDTLGMKLERGVLLANWLSMSKTWGSVLLEGKWEKFGMEGLGFTELVREVEVYKDGEKTGEKFYASGDSVMGKILGGAYYLHPRNFIRGAFLDGSLWLKLASDGNGNVNSKSLAYLLYNLTPGKHFAKFMKPFKNLSSKVTKFINPFFEGIKKFTKNLLTKVLGATGIGAVLVNVIMNFVSDKFAYIVNQIVMVVLLGLIGILFILFESSGIMYSDEKVSAILEDNEDNEIPTEDGIFSDSDWGIEDIGN